MGEGWALRGWRNVKEVRSRMRDIAKALLPEKKKMEKAQEQMGDAAKKLEE